MRKAFIFLAVLCQSIVWAQPPHLWVRTTGTTCQSRSIDIAVDHQGNVYEAGYFRDQGSNFDTLLIESPYQSGSSIRGDAYIFKYDSAGTFLWALKSNNHLKDQAGGIAADNAGNVYLAGSFDGDTLSFGSLQVTHTGNLKVKAFLLKVSPQGVPLWLKSYAPPISSVSYNLGMLFNSIIVNAQDELIVTGTINRDSAYIGNYLVKNHGTAGASSDFFMVKFDSSGNVLWVKQAISQNGFENIEQINLDAQNNIYVCGHTISNNLIFDNISLPSTINNAANEAFVFKLSNNGNVLWGDRFGAPNEIKPTQAQGIAIDDFGSIYLAGEFSATSIQFGPFTLNNNNTQLLSSGSRDLFVAKYDAQGNKLWIRGIQHNLNYDYSESIYRLQKSADNMIYGVGSFHGQSITWDTITVFNSIPTPTVSSGYNRIDPFFVKFDANGNAIWIKTLHGTTYYHNEFDETITSMKLDEDNNMYGAGFLLTIPNGLLVDTTVYYHPLPGVDNCSNSRDGFIIKIKGTMDNPTLPYIWNVSICNGDSVSVGNHLYYTSGTYTDTLLDSQNNDSIVVTNLTVITPDVNVTATFNTLSVPVASGATYQWIDCNLNNAPVAGATTHQFTPAATSMYAVIINQNGCIDTSACTQITILDNGDITHHQDNWKVFPNPSLNEFIILTTQHDEVTLFDITGKLLDTFLVKANEPLTYVQKLAQGCYLLIGKESGKHIKLIIQ